MRAECGLVFRSAHSEVEDRVDLCFDASGGRGVAEVNGIFLVVYDCLVRSASDLE